MGLNRSNAVIVAEYWCKNTINHSGKLAKSVGTSERLEDFKLTYSKATHSPADALFLFILEGKTDLLDSSAWY